MYDNNISVVVVELHSINRKFSPWLLGSETYFRALLPKFAMPTHFNVLRRSVSLSVVQCRSVPRYLPYASEHEFV